MAKPLLSVCLITYNQARFVEEAIESILSQRVNFPWEIVIADDFSTDGTREIIEKYRQKYPDLIKLILRDKNVGPEENWLGLMSYPRSKYVAYLEGDDYWTDPDKLQMQVDFLEKHPDFAISFHPAKVFFERGESKQIIWPNFHEKEELKIEELLAENLIPSNSVVYRRQEYDKLSRGIMPGDWYMHLYNAQFGRIGYIDRVMSSYRRHSEGLWWDHYQNADRLWTQYGAQHIALFAEMLRLYGKNDKLKKIIHQSLSAALGKLIEADSKDYQGLLKTVLKQFPELDIPEILANDQHRQLKEKNLVIQQMEHEIEKVNKEMIELRGEIFRLRDELHSLRNARLLGKIIKLRETIGTMRQYPSRLPRMAIHSIRMIVAPLIPSRIRKLIKQLPQTIHFPHKTVHGIRMIVAPFIPGPIRRFLKRIYRRLFVRRSVDAGPTLTSVPIKPWPKGVPLVSVIVPYFNRADIIDDTLNSIKAQTFLAYEIILVNDGSTDPDSVEKLKQIQQDTPKIKIIHQKNQGVAAARNTGISQAKGRYIVCLDSDDVLEPTFIEKSLNVLESSPDVALVTTYMETFGVVSELYQHIPYNALELYSNNMVITAAMFRKEAWQISGGYKPAIGYEDWEFWISLSEHGFWGKLIPESLFRYRTSMQSRYVEDKDVHWNNLKVIRSLHPKYKKTVKRLLAAQSDRGRIAEPKAALANLSLKENFQPTHRTRGNVLITIPWMTFGGAETLIYNYCREVKDQYSLSFITGLKSENEWEYKFKELSSNIYHLPNLFEDAALHLEFISNYIQTRDIQILHIIHNGFTFEMLPELKKRHPKLNVCLSMFNDRVEYFEQSIKFEDYIDTFVTDNNSVANHYRSKLKPGADVVVIPNGINCFDEFNPNLFKREEERKALGLEDDELAMFFVGRLSEEKNPDVFLRVARDVLSEEGSKAKFFVIGDGPMRAQVEKTIKAINSPRVTYLGYQAEVARYLSAADVFVLPSSIEGFPLSILEAMAMRVAVIASDVGAVADVIDSGTNGFVVKAGSAEEIQAAILKLTADQKLLETIKSNARQAIEKVYSNRILGANYKKLYGRLIK